MKKSPFKNSGNSWGEGGVIKDPLGMENPGGWGGGGFKSKCLSSVLVVWIFSGTTPYYCLGVVDKTLNCPKMDYAAEV